MNEVVANFTQTKRGMKQIKLLFRKRRRKQKVARSKRSKFTDQTRHCQAQNSCAYYNHEQTTSSINLLRKAAILDLAFFNLFIYISNQEKTDKTKQTFSANLSPRQVS